MKLLMNSLMNSFTTHLMNSEVLFADLAEFFQLPAQSEGGEDGVFTGQGDQRGGCQRLVDVQTRPGVPQAVHLERERASAFMEHATC